MSRGRREFPTSVIRERLERCGWRCEGLTLDGQRCPELVKPRAFQADHHLADWLGGKPVLENCRILCIPCHKAKTALDVRMISKAKRIERQVLVKREPVRKIQSRGFGAPGRRERESRHPPLQPPRIYR